MGTVVSPSTTQLQSQSDIIIPSQAVVINVAEVKDSSDTQPLPQPLPQSLPQTLPQTLPQSLRQQQSSVVSAAVSELETVSESESAVAHGLHSQSASDILAEEKMRILDEKLKKLDAAERAYEEREKAMARSNILAEERAIALEVRMQEYEERWVLNS